MGEIRDMGIGELEMELRRMYAEDVREVKRGVLTWGDGRIHLVFHEDEHAWEAVDTGTGKLSQELTDIGHLAELLDTLHQEASETENDDFWDTMFDPLD